MASEHRRDRPEACRHYPLDGHPRDSNLALMRVENLSGTKVPRRLLALWRVGSGGHFPSLLTLALAPALWFAPPGWGLQYQSAWRMHSGLNPPQKPHGQIDASLLADFCRRASTGRCGRHGSTVDVPSAHERCGSALCSRCTLRQGLRTQRQDDDGDPANKDRQDDVGPGSETTDTSDRREPRRARGMTPHGSPKLAQSLVRDSQGLRFERLQRDLLRQHTVARR
jgi:hypothetical protein